jgi:hypothetical protein
MRRPIVGATVLGLAAAMTVGVVAGAAATKITKSQLRQELLTISDMPSGWSVTNSSSNSAPPSCLAAFEHIRKTTPLQASADFEQGQVPQFEETLVAAGAKAASKYRTVISALSGCRNISFVDQGQTLTGQIVRMSLPSVGSQSQAFSMSFTYEGIQLGFDIDVFRQGTIDGLTTLGDIGTPDVDLMTQLTQAAVNKLGQPGSKPTSPAIGSTIKLTDQDGHPLSVTLVRIVDPAQGADQFSTPSSGDRFVGVELKITDTGTTSIDPNPESEAELTDTQGHGYNPDIGSTLSDCPSFPDNTNLDPGETVDGCVTFDVPTGLDLARVKYTPSSGFANDTGEWAA